MSSRTRTIIGAVFAVFGLLFTPAIAAAQPTFAPPAPPTSSAPVPAPPTQDPDVGVFAERIIASGFQMSNGGEVYSIDGRTKLWLLRGLLEVWVDNQHVWTAAQSRAGTVVRFQHDGNLVVYAGSTAVWASNTTFWCGPGNDNCSLRISDNGNVYIRDFGGFTVWQTNTDR